MTKKVNILLVDDDEEALEILSDILQEKGFFTETAKTGKEALAKTKEQFFNIVLLDIKLPDMTGIEVLKALQGRGKHLPTMTIIITANATVQNAIDANNFGAGAYLVKPIDPEALFRAIKDCLKKQETLNLQLSQGERKIPVSISLSSRIIQQIDQEAKQQKRTRSKYVELHFETYFFKETLPNKKADSKTPCPIVE